MIDYNDLFIIMPDFVLCECGGGHAACVMLLGTHYAALSSNKLTFSRKEVLIFLTSRLFKHIIIV